ncbi:PREDICTED: uncharacterized protein LOC107068554 [Polistes dominula]|uniref:Uncharacterized protein LOC107068554 n=1 Tax=Polistes dominula TaxID=743375 RepID=A0ABM1IK22_POLDO|nr:PREDICTED: uncharacterized protein LOC107068554 [Polistes dominula]
MKEGLWLVAIAATILAAADLGATHQHQRTIPTECPADDPFDTTVLLAHESDCSKFYVCFLGEKILKDCPYENNKGDRLHFNPFKQVCDYPADAGCLTPSISGKKLITPAAKQLTNKADTKLTPLVTLLTTPRNIPSSLINSSNVIKYKPHQCEYNLYYKIINGNEILDQCENNFHWNQELEDCYKPDETECTAKGISVTYLELPFDVSCIDGEFYIHECSCVQYYQCVSGNKVLKSCEKGLYWGQQQRKCTTPEEANCPHEKPKECTEGSTKPHPCECNLYYKCINGQYILRECPDGLHWSKDQCSQYYKCSDNRWNLQQCPGGLHWSKDRQICTTPEDAKCIKICDEGKHKPDDDKCEVYYECKDNRWELKYCPGGLHWDRVRDTCSTPESANCPWDCKEGSFLPHECECNIYYKCINYRYVRKVCQNGLHWDRTHNNCTSPDQANCPNYHPKICEEGSYKPDDKICEIYYKCENNQFVQKTCPAGLHWNRVSNICSDRDSAKCPNYHPKICDEGSYKPDDKICEIYYKCENNQFVQKTCPAGFHWNRVSNICTDPASANCPNAPRNCVEGSFKPHDCQCDIYYECQNNQYVQRKCVDGLHWDRTHYNCTLPDLAHCPNYHPKICDEGSTKPHNCKCNLYYKCINNQLVLKECENGLHWDRYNKLCALPDRAKCPNYHPKICDEGAHKADETECDIYYECQNNTYVKLRCSSGLHWDRTHNYCTTPDKANCPNYHPKICEEGTYKPDDKICEIYYKCENNQFVTKACTGGLHWNRIQNICTDPDSAKCPNYHPKICEEGTYKPDDNICEVYYRCENNQFVKKTCTGGLHWNRIQNICTDPSSAKCPNYHPRVCEEGSYSPHECQCDAYYKCINNELILQYCPSGKYWKRTENICTDPKIVFIKNNCWDLQVCVKQENANCKNKNEETRNIDIAPISSKTHDSLPQPVDKLFNAASINPRGVPDHCPAHDSGEVVHLPHETNCTLFYKCVEGNKVLHQCPPTLHFNPVKQVCDLPQFANCTSKPNKDVDEPQEIEEHSSGESLAQSSTKRPTKQGIPDHCPAHDSGEVVHLPHETNCTLFYKCDEGRKVLHQCPPTLHFNPVKQVCDLPQFANCTSKPNDEVDGQEEIENKLTTSQVKTTSPPSTKKPGGIPDHCPEHNTDEVVHLPHETNCSLFYKCDEGRKVVLPCPPGLHFNPKWQACDLPQNVNCTNKPGNGDGSQEQETTSPEPHVPVTTESPSTTKPGEIPDHCPEHDNGKVIHLPHETNCSLFYKCDEGRKVVLPCPPGLHFNSKLQVCDLPQNVNCTKKSDNGVDGQEEIETKPPTSQVTTTTRRPSTNRPGIPDHCPAHDSGEVVHLPHETNCTLFYKCDEGRKVLHQCPPTLHFNPVLQVCDLPQFANCTIKSGNEVEVNQELSDDTAQISSDSVRAPKECPPDDHEKLVHIPHETNCSLFYKCNRGQKILHQCPPTLHFNPHLNICDLPENAKCESKPQEEVDIDQELTEDVAQISSDSVRAPTECPADDYNKLVHIPHETNCSLFYKCNRGQKILHQCPPTLHFNPRLNICDLPENAKCESKPQDEVDIGQDLADIFKDVVV